jgi:4-alpha-glucanotransferase
MSASASGGTGLDWIRQQQEEQAARKPPPRNGGVLVHPTSLPGPHGIGDLGAGSREFIDWLARAKQTRWQILPLGPTGYGDSPYQSLSTFAGNPLLISLEDLEREGLLQIGEVENLGFPDDRVDFTRVEEFKREYLARAADGFKGKRGRIRDEYKRFCEEQAGWLDDFVLFMALKSDNDGKAWYDWPRELVLRDAAALDKARRRLKGPIETRKLIQFFFFRQWRALKSYANGKGIQIIGDIPIFVALDSADVWANQSGFQLDESGTPTAVAGVPPDYFSDTGQLWGNPLYDWEAMRADGYRWWIERFRATLALVDIVRIDHFRGFEAYWSVPAGEETAQNGEWVKGPGSDLFDAVRAELGEMPVIAEDLGLITPEVDALRDELGFPGMAVLQFAFGSGSDNLYLPHNVSQNTIIYSGTHDNDTTAGWYAEQDDATKDHVRRYLRVSGDDIAWDLIRAAWASVARTAIVPLQDILSLGNEARMNVPGQAAGNWTWRLRPGALTDDYAAGLADVSELYGRVGT